MSKTVSKFALAAGLMLAMIFTLSCSFSGGGCKEPDSNGRILVGSAIDYQTCMDAARKNGRCISGGIWNSFNNAPNIGECLCRAKACEEE